MFENLFKNTFLIIGILVSVIIICVISIIYFKIIKGRLGRILYFDPIEFGGEELNVIEIRARSLITDSEPMKRFIRTPWGKVYNFRGKIKSIPTWIARRGTAFLYKIQSTPEGKAEPEYIGSFWEGLQHILTDIELEAILPDVQERLIKSEIYVTVNIQGEKLPDDIEPISEDWILSDADDRVAELFGKRVREALSSKEDMIKIIALIGTGIAIALVLQGLGILPAFTVAKMIIPGVLYG